MYLQRSEEALSICCVPLHVNHARITEIKRVPASENPLFV